jgi:hypothetical protein
MVSIIAEEDIVKIGIWLRKEKLFQENKKLQSLWLLQLFATLIIQGYFAIEIFIQINQSNLDTGVFATELEDLD